MDPPDGFRVGSRRSKSRWNLLHVAAYKNADDQNIDRLLSTGRIAVNDGTTEGLTPLMIGAQEGHSRVVRILLGRGASVAMATNDEYGCTALHLSALEGQLATTKLLVEAGADLQATAGTGHAPLHLAALRGHSAVVTALVEAGSDLQANTSLSFTPLHLAAQNGHSAGIKVLLEAGADIEATNVQGCTPLHLAVENEHSVAMMELLKAGANPNSRWPFSGETPLYISASKGYVAAIKVLLHAKADPLLGKTGHSSGEELVPIDVAAALGHVSVVQELLQQCGIEGSAGANLGVQALGLAARHQQVDTMAVLVDAGVVDSGAALCKAARWGGEPAVKFLLERQEGNPIGADAYVNTRDDCGATPLMCAVGGDRCSPRVVRRLVDAGAETASAVRFTYTPGGKVDFDGTPLALTNRRLFEKKFMEEDATEEQLNGLEGTRRLLLRVAAVHARSWLWHSDVPSITDAAGEKPEDNTTSESLRMTLPILRRRARRRGLIFLTPLLRFSSNSAPGGEV